MKFFAIGAACFVGLILILAISLGLGYIDFGNTANQFENQVQAKYKDNQNVYDNGWKEVREKAQVPDAYASDMERLYKDLIQGRQGSPNELFRMIKEANPTLDSKLYVQIQQSIESFRQSFKQAQTELVSVKQEYQNYLTATTSGRFYNMLGHYPHIDLSKFDIVTSDQTQKAFDTKKADEIQIKK